MENKREYIIHDERMTICIPSNMYIKMQNDIEDLKKIKEGGTRISYQTSRKIMGTYMVNVKNIMCYGKDDVLSELKPHIEKIEQYCNKVKDENKELQAKLDKFKKMSWWDRLFNYQKIIE